MELLFQQIFNGIMLGSTYAIVAIGLTLVMGILHIPNFAHGHLYMLGAYITFFLIGIQGIGYWVALIGSALAMAIIGLFMERIVYRPLRKQPQVNGFIAAIGSLLFLETFVKVVWGAQGHRIPNPHPGEIELLSISVSLQQFLVIITTIVLIILLQLFIKKTKPGIAIEAVAQDREGAMLVGIDVNKVASMTFAISVATAGVAASLVTPLYMLSPTMGAMLGMKAFVIVILGGMGSIPGAIIGGYILGLVETLGGGYISAEYKDVFAFAVLILILAIKPSGLFGKEVS